MKARELRQKSIEELTNAEGELREQLFKLRFQKATGRSRTRSRSAWCARTSPGC